MRTTRIWITFLALCPGLIPAQTDKMSETSATSPTKLFHLRYAAAGRVEALLGNGGYHIRADDQMRVVLVQGPPEWLTSAAQLIQELDQPGSSNGPANVEVTVYVIAGSNKAPASPEITSPLEPVVKQLKAVFPYGSYETLSTIQVRSRDGEDVVTEGVLRNTAESSGRPHSYKLRYRPSYTGTLPGGQTAIALNAFGFEGFLDEARRTSLYTNVDLREGQRVVVGKTNIGDGSSGLFLVVSAKSVDHDATAANRRP